MLVHHVLELPAEHAAGRAQMHRTSLGIFNGSFHYLLLAQPAAPAGHSELSLADLRQIPQSQTRE